MNKTLIITLILAFAVTVEAKSPYAYLYKELPFEMPQINKPHFPANKALLTDFGGVGDGLTLNTEAFAKAFNALAKKGGGTLTVPSGLWFTGPIALQSNINLHLETGAIIIFSRDFDLYPLVQTVYEGLDTYRCQSPISGNNLENVAITGNGVIDGSGEAWRPLKRDKVTESQWKEFVRSGGIVKDGKTWYPSVKSYRGDSLAGGGFLRSVSADECLPIKDFLRPVMVSLVRCKNVLLEGVQFQNSPAWNIHPLICENVIIDNISVRNPDYAQNGDGIDLESCRNVIVVNSHFDVGDDAICIKSGKDEDGRRRGIPSENMLISNCRVFHGHGGFTVGSEMSGGVRNIALSDCQFIGTEIGLRFKSTRGRGGVVENIYIKRINMTDIINEALSFNLYYFTQKTAAVPPVDETTPLFRNIHVKDVISRNSNKTVFVYGLPEMNIRNFSIENSVFEGQKGAEIAEADTVTFKNVRIIAREGKEIITENVKNFKIE